MKYLLIFLFIILSINIYSQNKDQELFVKYDIGKKIIQGFEYVNDSLVKQTYHVDEFDKYGNTISFKTYDLNDSLIKQYNIKFSDDGKTEFEKILDKEGNLETTIINIRNDEERSIRRVQIGSNGDTLVHQFRVRDRNLNDSILFSVRNGKYTVSHKWNYNDGGMLISNERFDNKGNLIVQNNFTYEKKGNCIITKNHRNKVISHKCLDGNKEISKILKSRIGYRSGIKLVSEKGGERIETKLENGLLEKIEYYSKKGDLLALIKYTYVNN